jgi:ribosome-associated heat shock protein Hsp15
MSGCASGYNGGVSRRSSAKPEEGTSSALERVRVDVWLDVACLYKTRSEAQRACTGGKVEVNDQRAKPHRELRIGDTLTLSRPLGVRQKVVVRGLAENHVPKAQARELYEDVTPPPSPEEQAFQQLLRQARAPMMPTPSPDKRARRALRRLKGRED